MNRKEVGVVVAILMAAGLVGFFVQRKYSNSRNSEKVHLAVPKKRYT